MKPQERGLQGAEEQGGDFNIPQERKNPLRTLHTRFSLQRKVRVLLICNHWASSQQNQRMVTAHHQTEPLGPRDAPPPVHRQGRHSSSSLAEHLTTSSYVLGAPDPFILSPQQKKHAPSPTLAALHSVLSASRLGWLLWELRQRNFLVSIYA